MSDEDTTTEATETTSGPVEQDKAEPKVYDEAYVKQLRDEAAKYRQKARGLEPAAQRLAEIEESQKTEAQKQQERTAALEAELNELRSAEQRRIDIAEVAAESGVPAEYLPTGLTRDALAEHAEKLKSLIEQSTKPKRLVHPSIGDAPGSGTDIDLNARRVLLGE